MKCEKCDKPAVVHLTELLPAVDGGKRPEEKHYCLDHALELGVLNAGVGGVKPSQESKTNIEQPIFKAPIIKKTVAEIAAEALESEAEAGEILAPDDAVAAARPEADTKALDPEACPICGITWAQFKQSARLGCPHDYTLFAAKLGPLIKRSQENFGQHAGKVPLAIRQSDPGRIVAAARLKRELDQAIDAENYEQAARLRDQLKGLEAN
ncbi:MAG: UvrB/UvrC motif-containing protein [Phycisphaerae bacterium]